MTKPMKGITSKSLSVKPALAEMLNSLYPEYEFNEDWIYRERGGNVKNGYECRWWAEGRKYTSFLRYNIIHVHAIDPMKICAKKGLKVSEAHKPLNVVESKG